MMLARVKCGYDLYEQEKGKFFQKGDVCVYIDIRMLKQQNMEIIYKYWLLWGAQLKL